MSTEELVSGVLEGLKLNALDLSALFRTALLILAGVVVIRVLLRIVDRMLSRSQNLGSVGGYIRSVVRIALWFLLVLVVADSLGIPVASMIALLSVAGLAISLALQNTLSNLAGGIMILVSKPFEVGDYVEADGVGGTVISIGLAYSTLATVDNKEIFIPNSQVAAAKIINYTKLGKRRGELTFSASYDAPTETVKQALGEVLAQFPQILEDPAPSIWISKYGASSIEYVVRMWTAAGDYWDVDRLDWYYDRWIDNGAEAWYREATAYALDNSLILPFGRSFEGGEVLNRGQFVAILSRLEGIDRDAVEQTGQFTDVTAADYFAPAVYWASASGVVEGTMTTPFDMRVQNNIDRFSLVIDTVKRLPQLGNRGAYLVQKMNDKLVEHRQYIRDNGIDLPEVRNWKWEG